MNKTEEADYDVVSFENENTYDKRWAIQIGGLIVDDAQGYGYKTKKSAHKAAWYKYYGGKEKMKKQKIALEKFEENRNKFFQIYMQETERFCTKPNVGQVTIKQIIKKIEQELDIHVPISIKRTLVNNNKKTKKS